MPVETIIVSNADDALSALSKALSGGFDENATYQLDLSQWPEFSYVVNGEGFNSSLPTSALKALSLYQAALNTFYARLAYNKPAQSLTDEDKKELEITFRFCKGSSETKAELGRQLARIGIEAVKKMTGNQIVITVITSALLLTAYLAYTNHLDATAQAASESETARLLAKAIEANERIASLNADLGLAAIAMVKSVPEADSVQLGSRVLDRDAIDEYLQRDRSQSLLERLDGKYRVTRVAETDSGYRVGLARGDGSQLSVSMGMDGDESASILSLILASVSNKEPVELRIIAKKRNGAISDASILVGKPQEALPYWADSGSDDIE